MRFQELISWLETLRVNHPATIACIQETHWAHDCEFSDLNWHFLHSGSGVAEAGVLFAVPKTLVPSSHLRFNSLMPGRLFHLRVELNPAIDLLGVYQFSWNPHQAKAQSPEQQALDLAQKRAAVWHSIQSWARRIPSRNSLLVLGDMNCTLQPQPPFVGAGVAQHRKDPHPDQNVFQGVIQNANLLAMNSWGRKGPAAGTFLQHSGGCVQLDFMLTRLPAPHPAYRAKPVPSAPIIHPSGFRHVPVVGILPAPARPKPKPGAAQLTAHNARRQLKDDPDRVQRFTTLVAQRVSATVDINQCLLDAWAQSAYDGSPGSVFGPIARSGGLSTAPTSRVLLRQNCNPKELPISDKRTAGKRPRIDPADPHKSARPCQQATRVPSAVPVKHQPVNLQQYWQCKRTFRRHLDTVQAFQAPVIMQFAQANPPTIRQHFPRTLPRLRGVLRAWRSAVQFYRMDREMRKHARAHKAQLFDDQVQQAFAAEKQGISALYQLIRRLRPKSSKRSIHFRDSCGDLMSPADEMAALKQYFRQLYASADRRLNPWFMPEPLSFAESEVLAAIRSMPEGKALPPGDAPAALWRVTSQSLAPALTAQLNSALRVGRLCFPPRWHESHAVLIPKVGKPPTKPANLRPIALLPGSAKVLAKLAADRLRPFVQSALENTPQFAYLAGREAAQALDRVLSHCSGVRSDVQSTRIRPSPHAHTRSKPSRFAGSRLVGGLQLSLDLAKAYDKLPRARLLEALARVQAPAPLQALIMFIHDNSMVVLERHGLRESVALGRGVRQGCGLSPLLWLSYMLLIFDKLSLYVPNSAITCFADDFHLAWRFHRTFEFRNACTLLPRILQDFSDLGMEVSVEKTVVLLALSGPDAPGILRDYTQRTKAGRYLVLKHPAGTWRLPIKSSHTYLGVKIGYGLFERQSLQYRLSQSWTAFHRLNAFLCSRQLPLLKRVQLWRACVWSIMNYGLTAVGVDRVSAVTLRRQVLKQLRSIARSPAHVTKETNHALLTRLHLQDPVLMLRDIFESRVARSPDEVVQLQPPSVPQWHSLVRAGFVQHHTAPDATDSVLTEVTQVLRVQCSCPVCGQQLGSTHALHVNIGKSHPERQVRKERSTTIKNKRVDDYRKHAAGGRPECIHCKKRFCGWPSFMGHFSQQACPVLFTTHVTPLLDRPTAPEPPTASPPPGPRAAVMLEAPVSSAHGAFAPGGEVPEQVSTPVPVFHGDELQALAKAGNITELAAAIVRCDMLHHCPECFQRCSQPSYISRHAQIHPQVKEHESSVRRWLEAKTQTSQPCRWCRQVYQSRPRAHLKGCPVLWACGHFLARHHTLCDAGQPSLQHVFGRQARDRPAAASGGQCRVRPVRQLHEAAGAGLASPRLQPDCDAAGHADQLGGGEPRRRVRNPGTGGPLGYGRGDRPPQAGYTDHSTGHCSSDSRPRDPEAGERALPDSRAHSVAARPRLADLPPVAEQEGVRPQQGRRDPAAEAPTAGHGATGLALGRLSSNHPAGLGVRDLLSDRGDEESLEHHRSTVSGGFQLEAAKRGRPGFAEPATAEHLVSCHGDGFARTAGASGEGSRSSPARDRARPSGGRDVPISPVGRRATPAPKGQHAAVQPGRPSSECEPDAPAIHLSQHGRALPCAAAPHGDLDLGGAAVFAHHPPPQHRSSAAIPVPAPHRPQLVHASDRSHSSAQQTGTESIGAVCGQAGPSNLMVTHSQALNLTLSNRANYCYAHAVLHSLAWSVAHLAQGFGFRHAHMLRFLQWLLSRTRAVALWDIRGWCNITQAWHQPHRQQDAAEFLRFLSFALPEESIGVWQSRVAVAAEIPSSQSTPAQVSDHGVLWPLELTARTGFLAPQAACSLQQLIIAWRNQPARHAGVSLPAILPVQVNRFNERGDKVAYHITPSPAAYVPFFSSDTLQTCSERYSLVAVVFHLGTSSQSGHYRAAFLRAGRITHVTDDDTAAQPASSAEIDVINQNSYIYFLVKHSETSNVIP